MKSRSGAPWSHRVSGTSFLWDEGRDRPRHHDGLTYQEHHVDRRVKAEPERGIVLGESHAVRGKNRHEHAHHGYPRVPPATWGAPREIREGNCEDQHAATVEARRDAWQVVGVSATPRADVIDSLPVRRGKSCICSAIPSFFGMRPA